MLNVVHHEHRSSRWIALIILLMAFSVMAIASRPSESAEPLQADADGKPIFDADNRLSLPARYREWIFVGSSWGLTYATAGDKSAHDETFKHVYVNPFGYREYRRTGQFPVGTMFLLEIARAGRKTEPTLHGAFSAEFTGLEAAVKSGDRFSDAWTYYSFDADNGQLTRTGRRFSDNSCISCHQEHGATDHVFTQFYPGLQPPRIVAE